jgi:hypothetical protein
MRKTKPDKSPSFDDLDADVPAPKPEPVDDEETMAKLASLKAPAVDEAEPPAAVIAKIPEPKRAEASAALKARWRRMRAYVSGESEEVDL